MADSLGLPLPTVRHTARQLQRADYLPKGRGGRGGVNAAEAEPFHAVLLLIALGAGSSPKNAVAAIERFGAMPCREKADVVPGGPTANVMNLIPIEDIQIGPGDGPIWNALTQTLAVALVNLAFWTGNNSMNGYRIENIVFERRSTAPYVAVEFTLPDAPPGQAEMLVYRWADDGGLMPAPPMSIMCQVSGSVMRDIAEFFASEPVAAAEMVAAE